MRAYRKVITVEDPKRLVVEPSVTLRKGQRVELVLMVEDDESELEFIRDTVTARGITEADVQDAIRWARSGA